MSILTEYCGARVFITQEMVLGLDCYDVCFVCGEVTRGCGDNYLSAMHNCKVNMEGHGFNKHTNKEWIDAYLSGEPFRYYSHAKGFRD